MDKKLIQIKKRIEKEDTIYEKLEKQLHTNPIKNRLNQFLSGKLKSSVLDLLRSKWSIKLYLIICPSVLKVTNVSSLISSNEPSSYLTLS